MEEQPGSAAPRQVDSDDSSPGFDHGAALEARGLTRHFGAHRALEGLDLAIAPGEAFGLLGANGAGKTTFLRLVTGYLLPTAGEVAIDGLSPARNPQAVAQRIGFVAETTRLYPELRVRAFLHFVAGARDLPKAIARERVAAGLRRFDLEDVADRPIGHLSKGFQQRVNLAQGFLHDPALLLVDEPTSGLDPLQQAEVRGVLRGLRGERTLLLCTHDLGEARELTSRVAVLHRGRLVALGATAEVLAGDPLALFRGEGRAA
jgi:ABC-2 type transport system ATP-binding protein